MYIAGTYVLQGSHKEYDIKFTSMSQLNSLVKRLENHGGRYEIDIQIMDDY